MTNIPNHILLFSGKRKSGKDYITDNLYKKLGSDKSVIIKLSGPIKNYWANKFNLDLNQLLNDGIYKESYRLEMIKWGENKRRKDNGYFCKEAIKMYNATNKKIWIISDTRRKTDIQWFKKNYGELCKTIRINCNNDIKSQRGWKFTPGIDDSETECDLDDINEWDLEIINEGDDIDNIIDKIIQIIS